MLGNKASVEVARHKLGVRQQGGLKRNIAADAANHKAIQGFAHLGNRLQAVFAVHDELGDHRVVEHRDFAAVDHPGVHTHAVQILRVGRKHGLPRRCKFNQPPGGRQEVAKRVFGVDAAFHGPAIALHISLY